ncbi:uncharacterized protein LOC131940747 [Physella acuta]|uniref:uncharacterized protein LOC131940747 n=1 Tax=Physella acuta TaxID=109671 RepID=UPI0027DB8655|nr:uncharacterized protein LOC131940747 [Physella acuta]XP_059155508.1 uncharacterized protein LOC131940747 [Physella acuta]XP_059155510.1 uncharacterized protein LOC131940747 [Physella acuta]
MELPVLTLMLLLFIHFSKASDYKEIYLNSYANCGQTYIVGPHKGMLIKTDVSPTTTTNSFRDCQVTFRSEEDDGKLCVVQYARLNEIRDSNVEFVVKDGISDEGKKIFTLAYYPNAWRDREYCTTSPYIYMYLRKLNKNTNVNITQVLINLKVLSIDSKERKLYFDDDYCDKAYKLSKSEVTLYNRSPPPQASFPGRFCTIALDKEPEEDSSICLVYIPLSTSHECKWKLTVTKDKLFSQKEHALYALNSTDSSAQQMGAWCGSNETHWAMAVFERLSDQCKSEPEQMFKLILTDHDGSIDGLLDRFRSEEPNSSQITTIVIAVVVCLLVIAVIALSVYLYMKYRSEKYQSVHNPQNKANC